MINVLPKYLFQIIKNFENYQKWRCKKKSYESVYFYTFHKCASVLFSDYVLKNIDGLRHVDYANKIYAGKKIDNLTFKKEGFVYGPIRLSVDHKSPVYTKLVEPLSSPDFIRSKVAVFLVRDPRDILVSAYYSFGYSHGFSPVTKIRKRQVQLRDEIQNKTIDQYALEYASLILDNFETVDKLSKACNRSVVLRYEDMILNWDYFVEGLARYFAIKHSTLMEIYKLSRPQEKEDIKSHRRSGMPGGFRSNLTQETIKSLNIVLEPVIERFQYGL